MDLRAYSSIGSPHINQMLRNVLGRATVAECPAATDSQQRLSLHLVEAHDSALAEACKSGLLWEVLAHAIELEEPDAVTCIQSALNGPANAVMLMHEMQLIKHLTRVCSAEVHVVGEVSVQAVRYRLIQEGFPAANTAAFTPMLQFVVEQGAGGDPAYVESLVQFHELMVNPRVRRLRESNYRTVCGVKSQLFACTCSRLRMVAQPLWSGTVGSTTSAPLKCLAWEPERRTYSYRQSSSTHVSMLPTKQQVFGATLATGNVNFTCSMLKSVGCCFHVKDTLVVFRS
jgi:hypothetical protein